MFAWPWGLLVINQALAICEAMLEFGLDALGAREPGAIFWWGCLVDRYLKHDTLASGLSRGREAADTGVGRQGAKARPVHG